MRAHSLQAGRTALASGATLIVSTSTFSMPPDPISVWQRTSDAGSQGGLCWKQTAEVLPVNIEGPELGQPLASDVACVLQLVEPRPSDSARPIGPCSFSTGSTGRTPTRTLHYRSARQAARPRDVDQYHSQACCETGRRSGPEACWGASSIGSPPRAMPARLQAMSPPRTLFGIYIADLVSPGRRNPASSKRRSPLSDRHHAPPNLLTMPAPRSKEPHRGQCRVNSTRMPTNFHLGIHGTC